MADNVPSADSTLASLCCTVSQEQCALAVASLIMSKTPALALIMIGPLTALKSGEMECISFFTNFRAM